MTKIDVNRAFINQVRRTHYSESLYDFSKAAWHIHHPASLFVPNWHAEAVCEHLEAQTKGQIPKLIINMPPGFGKSLFCGVYWPAWEWLTNPSTQFLATAATETLAKRDNDKARDLITSEWYQEICPLTLTTDSIEKFVNEHKGYRWCVPFSSITGHRGDRVIVDDAISADDARFDNKLQSVNDKYWTSIPTRVNDPQRSTFTIVQQRLREKDLIGSILEREGDDWVKLILPMEYVPTTYVSVFGWRDPRTEVGELLFPDRWSESVVASHRRRDPYVYASQFQQDPVPTTDGLFKKEWIDDHLFDRKQVFDENGRPSKDFVYYLATDHAVDEGAKNDFNVCLVLAMDAKKDIYVVDHFRERCIAKAAMGIAADDNGKLSIAPKGALALAKKYRPHRWFAESDNNFKAIQSLVKDTMRATGVHVAIETVSPHGKSKAARSSALQSYMSLGKVHFERGSRLYADALQEFVKFPVGKHDDIVDALAVFCRVISEAHPAVVSPTSEGGTIRSDYQGGRAQDKGRQAGFF